MIDPQVTCPTVPVPDGGTMGHSLGNWDSDGTSWLKLLAAEVLVRNSMRDNGRTIPKRGCPIDRLEVPLPFNWPARIETPARLGSQGGPAEIPDVPAAWLKGVARMALLAAPDSIPPLRWATLASTSTRLLWDHGAELHRDGWDVLDLFGLHSVAPMVNPTGWGLAWLLGSTGIVLEVAADVIGLCRQPGEFRMGFRRRADLERAGTVPAWALCHAPG